MSKVVRLDDAVWKELQRRARPLEDKDVNDVLRREFNLPAKSSRQSGVEGDSRVAHLLQLVQERDSGNGLAFKVRSDGQLALRSDKGRAFGSILAQRKMLKVEVRETWARELGSKDWDHFDPRGYYSTEGSCWWHLEEDDGIKYDKVASILAFLKRRSV